MGLFHKKAETNVVTEEPELTPFVQHKEDILEDYSGYNDDQLFKVIIQYDSGQTWELGNESKDSVAWLLAHKLSGEKKSIFQYSRRDGQGVCIDMGKVEGMIVTPIDNEGED